MGDDDELEYHLTFPSTVSNNVSSLAKNNVVDDDDDEDEEEDDTKGQDTALVSEDFVFVYEEDKRPVVVLLGWAGCQDKYLAKYSAIYEDRR